MDKQAYLDRIKIESVTAPSRALLFQLQQQHLLHVPFENLDIHHQRPIRLALPAIFQKIVGNRRGGFCYELNGLFCWLLRELGFAVEMISARVPDNNGVYSPEFDHLALLVKVEGKTFLADVGFGKFSFQPIELLIGQAQQDPFGQFIIVQHDEDYLRIDTISQGVATPGYIFKTQARAYEEFAGMCHYHQTDPNSHFLRNKLITIAQLGGRMTLINRQLKITRGDSVEETEFAEGEFEQYLEQYFGIVL
ncbi:MAG: arylamine N-acetyltransferase [Bacteroidota bacterium]